MQIKQNLCVLNKMELISTQSGKSLKLVDQIPYLRSNISSTESDVKIRLMKAWTVIDWLSIIGKFYQSNKIKRYFFLAVAVFILLYEFTS